MSNGHGSPLQSHDLESESLDVWSKLARWINQIGEFRGQVTHSISINKVENHQEHIQCQPLSTSKHTHSHVPVYTHVNIYINIHTKPTHTHVTE